MAQGMISVRTLTDLASLRTTGTALVLITGAAQQLPHSLSAAGL